jgi:peptide/nickel transport system ATP-binding protein
MSKGTVSVEVKGLNVGYITDKGYTRVVRNANISIPEGKITGIVGESGSGKSTLANSLIGFINPPLFVESGSVIVDGKYDVLAMDPDQLNQVRGKIISYVPQAAQNSLNPIRKVKDTINDMLRGHGMDLSTNRESVLKTMEMVGLSDRQVLDMYPFQLSGGMRQRVIIAISLLLSPRIVVMDEPTTGLDVIVQYDILKLIKKLQKQMSLTIVFISHDIAMLFQISDYVAVMYGGQIVEYGEYSELLGNARHPYTYLMLNSVPTVSTLGRKLTKIPGEFEGFSNYPKGCVFSQRCPFATPQCRDSPPQAYSYAGVFFYKCSRYPEWRDQK